MIELDAREYARLESERAELNSGRPSENEALKRAKSFQRQLRRRERERFVAEHAGTSAAKPRAAAIRLDWLRRKGREISKRFFSSVPGWFAAFRGPDAWRGKRRLR